MTAGQGARARGMAFRAATRYLALAAAAVGVAVTVARAPALAEALLVLAQISGDPENPRRHFRVRNPARLGATEAGQVYRRLADTIEAAYRSALGAGYLDWRRYNTAPYLSSTHGQLYVNNYANAAGAAYGRYERGGPLPEGAVLIKDSLRATADGEIAPGPIFVMEKMAKGFNYVSGDWRYSVVTPEGALWGETNGAGAQRVDFCIGCHLAREITDHLYFPPPELRVKF